MVRPARGQARRSCVLCTQMRSGSWMLSDLCQQSGLLGQPEEYFRPDFRGHWSDEWGIDITRSYAEYITSAVGNTSTDNGVFGVKMHSYQMDWFLRQLRRMWGARPDDDDMDLLCRWLPNPTFIHLKRLDVARQAISYYRAVHSNVWFELRADDPAAPVHNQAGAAVPTEPDWGEVRYLENGLRAQEKIWSDLFERNSIEPLELIYEEVTEEPEATVDTILEVMGIDTNEEEDFFVEPRLKKQADDSTDRWLEQYQAHRDSVEPVKPMPKRLEVPAGGPRSSGPGQPGAGQPDAGQPGPGPTSSGPGPAGPNRRAGTAAPGVFRDKGPKPPDLTPADYTEGRVSWAELVASLVMSGLPVSAAAVLVDALPGDGAVRTAKPSGRDWRAARTPLPPQPI